MYSTSGDALAVLTVTLRVGTRPYAKDLVDEPLAHLVNAGEVEHDERVVVEARDAALCFRSAHELFACITEPDPDRRAAESQVVWFEHGRAEAVGRLCAISTAKVMEVPALLDGVGERKLVDATPPRRVRRGTDPPGRVIPERPAGARRRGGAKRLSW